MSIAYSKQPIVRATASGATRAALIDSLAGILTSAGWTAETIATGKRMMCTSPQGLQAKLWLQDLGEAMVSIYGPAVSLRMSCADLSHSTATHKLMAGRDYDVIAGRCQAFVAMPDVSSQVASDGYWGHHFACGVPWLPETPTGDCTGRLSTDVGAAWWLSSSGLHSFRNGYQHEYSNWAGYWSTDGLAVRGAVSLSAHLQARVKSLMNDPYSTPPQVVYGNGDPMYLDPLIAWGTPGESGPPKIRGQIWDAVWPSLPLDLGETFQLDEVDETTGQPFQATFENWTYSHEAGRIPPTWLGCLCLALPGTGGSEGNYAY
ncbi:MAG: hypothetical protein ABFD89_29305 [Bryobacteraceae bacterium]